jgi:hypothetical protein
MTMWQYTDSYFPNYSQNCPCGHLYKGSLVFKDHFFLVLSCHSKFQMNQPLLIGHLFYKATFSWSQRWPLNTGLPVILHTSTCVSHRCQCTNIKVIICLFPTIWKKDPNIFLICLYIILYPVLKASWSSSYDSWIYLSNQCH